MRAATPFRRPDDPIRQPGPSGNRCWPCGATSHRRWSFSGRCLPGIECSLWLGQLLKSLFQSSVELWAALAQRGDGAVQFLFAFPDVGVYIRLMAQVVSDRPVHLLQRQRREVLADGFGRLPLSALSIVKYVSIRSVGFRAAEPP